MNSYVTRQQVRQINRKLFANDILYTDEDSENTFKTLLSDIVQQFNPEDALANVPSILEVKDNNISESTYDKLLILNPKSIYIQFNNRVLGNQDNVAIIRDLKEQGFKIVIEINEDDKVFTLTKVFADIVKFDIQKAPPMDSSFQCKTLAYNVNTPEDYNMAEVANIDLYEGTYVGESTELKIDNNEHSNLNFVQLISMLSDDRLDIKELSTVVARDPLMSAQVIRLSNSVYFGSRTRIDSISDAIIRIGIEKLKRWVFLLEFTKHGKSKEAMIQMSYQRALFCERLAKKSKKCSIKPNDAYMIGLFSALDMLTGKPLSDTVMHLNLKKDIEDSLIYRDGDGGLMLNLMRAYEEANWERIQKYITYFKLNKDEIYEVYFGSLNAAQELWANLTELGAIN